MALCGTQVEISVVLLPTAPKYTAVASHVLSRDALAWGPPCNPGSLCPRRGTLGQTHLSLPPAQDDRT